MKLSCFAIFLIWLNRFAIVINAIIMSLSALNQYYGLAAMNAAFLMLSLYSYHDARRYKKEIENQ